MSDEGLVNLEDDDGVGQTTQEGTQQVQQAAAEAQEAAGQTPPQAEGEGAAEVDAVEVAGNRYVPLKAVQESRAQAKQAKEAAQQAIARAQQLEQQYAQIAPFAEILRQNPDLLKPRQEAAPTPADPQDDPDLVALAQSLDLYDPQTGKPDTKKASLITSITEKRAARLAENVVKPLQEQQLIARAQQNYQQVLNTKLPNGQAINQQVFNDLWRQAASEPGGLQTLSNPQSVAALALMAAGAAAWNTQPQIQQPLAPPLVTEGSGGVPKARPYLSNIEAKIAKEKGISDSQWAKNVAGFTKGGPSALED